jgi:hypothetical protein
MVANMEMELSIAPVVSMRIASSRAGFRWGRRAPRNVPPAENYRRQRGVDRGSCDALHRAVRRLACRRCAAAGGIIRRCHCIEGLVQRPVAPNVVE